MTAPALEPSLDSATLTAIRRIVSHADCPDGLASALILRDVFPDAEVVFVEHATVAYRQLQASPGTLFCDVAPPADRVEPFVEAGAIVLDHHREARAVIEAFGPRGVFADEDRRPGVSGAWLAYEQVWRPLRSADDREPRVRRFAELAGVRDTWQTDHPGWDEACAQAAALTFFGWEELEAQPYLDDLRLATGRILVRRQRETAREIAEGKLFSLTDRVRIYNDRDRLLSDVAEHAFERDPEVVVVAGFHYKVAASGAMILVCALRSRAATVDVGAIATAQGGGGHRHAAGFSLPVGPGAESPVGELRPILGDV